MYSYVCRQPRISNLERKKKKPSRQTKETVFTVYGKAKASLFAMLPSSVGVSDACQNSSLCGSLFFDIMFVCHHSLKGLYFHAHLSHVQRSWTVPRSRNLWWIPILQAVPGQRTSPVSVCCIRQRWTGMGFWQIRLCQSQQHRSNWWWWHCYCIMILDIRMTDRPTGGYYAGRETDSESDATDGVEEIRPSSDFVSRIVLWIRWYNRMDYQDQ